MSVATAISDRICIHSDQTLQTEISARNLLACTKPDGCYGGNPLYAWNYWKKTGIVSGGAYGSNIVSIVTRMLCFLFYFTLNKNNYSLFKKANCM